MRALTVRACADVRKVGGARASPRRCIPARGLVAYLEYEGLDAHARAWQATAARDLLVKTPAGAMLIDVFKQATSSSIKQVTRGELDAPDLIAFTDQLVRKGFVCGFYSKGIDDLGAVVVLKEFGKTDLARRSDRLRPLLTLLVMDADAMLPGPHHVRGRQVREFLDESAEQDKKNPLYVDEPPGATPRPPSPPFLSAWMEGDNLVLVLGNCGGQPGPASDKDHIAVVLDTIEGKQPDVTTHPGFISALAEGKDLKGFDPNGLWFIDTAGDFGTVLLVSGLDFAAGLVMEPVLSALFSSHPDTTPAGLASPHPKDGPAPPAGAAGPKNKKAAATKKAANAIQAEPQKVNWIAETRRDLGLDGIERIVGRWGSQGKALLSDVRIEAPAPRKALAAWFDQPAFRTDRLPGIPADATDFVIASFDLDGSYRTFLDYAKGTAPGLAEVPVEDPFGFERAVEALIGLRLRDNLLAPRRSVLGDGHCPGSGRRERGPDPAEAHRLRRRGG